jgi:hypothetical protein
MARIVAALKGFTITLRVKPDRRSLACLNPEHERQRR